MKKKKRTVIKNKKRFTMFVLTLVMLITCGFSSVRNHNETKEVKTISVFVDYGDTLWDIAKNNNPNNEDVRTLVYEIKKCNNLNSNTIKAGDEILIPV